MNNAPKRPISPVDTLHHLNKQVHFLEISARLFDVGVEDEATRLATAICVLVHDTKWSRSILSQLGLKDVDFIDTAEDYNERNLLPSFTTLINIRSARGTVKYVSPLGDTPSSKKVSSGDWWEKIIFKDELGRTLTRKSIVLTMANQHGGKHVDPGLDDVFFGLCKENSLGWFAITDSGFDFIRGAENVVLRQIAYEVLESVKPFCGKNTQTPFLEINISNAQMSADGPPAESYHENEGSYQGDFDSIVANSIFKTLADPDLSHDSERVHFLVSNLRNLVGVFALPTVQGSIVRGLAVLTCHATKAGDFTLANFLFDELKTHSQETTGDAAAREYFAIASFNLLIDAKERGALIFRDKMLDELRRFANVNASDSKVREYLAKGIFNGLCQADAEGNIQRRDEFIDELRSLYSLHREDTFVRMNLAMALSFALYWANRDRDQHLRFIRTTQLDHLVQAHRNDETIKDIWRNTKI